MAVIAGLEQGETHEPATISLALGAGGARGFAHIGALRGLEAIGLRPAGIAGASMGALVGSLYALGMTTDELIGLGLGARIRAAVRPRFSRVGLLDPEPLAEMVLSLVGDATFADTIVPLAVTAVDLVDDSRVVIDEGPIAAAVVASMMVPSVFPPRQLAGRWLSDPGGVEPVPIDPAASFDVDAVVAVSGDLARNASGAWLLQSRAPISWLCGAGGRLCSVVGTRARWPGAGQLGRVLHRMQRGKDRPTATCPVIWIQPAFGFMNANQFGACERAIRLGEEAVARARPLLTAVAGTRTPERRRDACGRGADAA